jgi:hypothetical protein
MRRHVRAVVELIVRGLHLFETVDGRARVVEQAADDV